MIEEGRDPSAGPRSVLRRLYDWTLSWADHPAGSWALFFIAFLESSIFPIPPDVLLIALCVGGVTKSYRFALICTTGSLLGGLVGYGIGYWGYAAIGEPIVKFYNAGDVVDKIKVWYDEYGFWGNLIAAVTPIPYKVFTIASGMFKFSIESFLLASVIGRSLRFFAVATTLYLFGEQIRGFIDRYFNWCAWIFMALVLAGVAAIKFL